MYSDWLQMVIGHQDMMPWLREIACKFITYLTDEVIFDNTYSWTRGKRLFYHVELHMTDDSTKSEVDSFIPGADGWEQVAAKK